MRLARSVEGFGSPDSPMDGVIFMLSQIGAAGFMEFVHGG